MESETESSVAKSCCPPSGSGASLWIEFDSELEKGGSSVGEEKSKAHCKCGEGWSCVISKAESGLPFYNCPDSTTCVCITEEGAAKVETEAGAYCVCGEGYACTITKTHTDTLLCDCGNGYTCLLNHSTAAA